MCVHWRSNAPARGKIVAGGPVRTFVIAALTGCALRGRVRVTTARAAGVQAKAWPGVVVVFSGGVQCGLLYG